MAFTLTAVMIDPKTRDHMALLPEQNEVAVAAATAVFARAKLEPIEAARADFDLEGYDIVGSEREITDETFDRADIWGEAHEVMREALLARWPDIDAIWVTLNLTG